jgi:sugar phosphate isomerase/epimerase
MRIGASTLGFLHHRSLPDALGSIAAAGYRVVDVSPAPPHLYLPGIGMVERLELKALLGRLGLSAASVNPIELNLVSTNPGYAELSREYLRHCLELAHDLEAPFLAFSPGRPFAPNPAPKEQLTAALVRQLELLVPVAERFGVVLCVETVPFGFMQTGREVAAVVDELGSPCVRASYDVANTLTHEDAAEGLAALGDRLAIAHVSGAWRDRWAHTSVREGDVDLAAFRRALADVDFDGPTIYELIDGRDPEQRLADDLPLLLEWGWEV